MAEQGEFNSSNPPGPSTESSSAPPPGYRPPLPPRDVGHLSPNLIPQQGRYYSQSTTLSWANQDPRNASTESIVPSSEPSGKRILLLVYIHGFLGDETSFQSFPAHVHNHITTLLQDTHVVHTKIYPKYKSRKHIQFARDDFSQWISPHEGKNVDVILCGHSMGGLLSAEVALLPPPSPEDPKPFKHRILGTINFDVPFLGLHPGVVVSGIGSLFRAAPKSPPVQPVDQPLLSPNSTESEAQTSLASGASVSTLSLTQPPANDPTYNPPFPNDIRLPARKGWDSTLHFLQKHSDGLTRATKSYVKSHLEFGGAVTDQLALRARYRAIRALEDAESNDEQSGFRVPRRVRFVNYYTASTGIPKKSPVQKPEARKSPSPSPSPNRGPYTESTLSTSHSAISSPRISVEEPRVAHDAGLQEHGAAAQAGKVGDTSRTPSTGGSFVSFVSTPDETDSLARSRKETVEQEQDAKAPRSSSQVDPRSASATYIPYPPGPSTVGETQKNRLSTSVSTPASTSAEALTNVAPAPEPDSEPEASGAIPSPKKDDIEPPSLPPLPELPEAPAPFDTTAYSDKDAQKLAKREHEQRVKAHARAVKDRDQAIKDRKKIQEKREREAKKKQKKEEEAAAKQGKEEAKRQQKEEEAAYKQWRHELKDIERKQKAREKQAVEDATATTSEAVTERAEAAPPAGSGERRRPTPLDLQDAPEAGAEAKAGEEKEKEKKRKDRRFCLIPSRDSRGRRDPAWVRVFMRDVDEVIAHCGLFDAWREHYAGFVLEVGQLVQEWVEDGGGRGRQEEDREGGESSRTRVQNDSVQSDTWVQRDDDGTERGVIEA